MDETTLTDEEVEYLHRAAVDWQFYSEHYRLVSGLLRKLVHVEYGDHGQRLFVKLRQLEQVSVP